MLYLCLPIIGACLVLFILTPLYEYRSRTKRKHPATILIKGLTSGVSFAFALIGYLRLRGQESLTDIPNAIIDNYWIVVGLGLCVLADMVLCIHVVTGGVLFFFGHVAYVIFFFTLATPHPVSIFIFTILCVASLCYFYKYSPQLDGLIVPVTLYGILIFASLSIGITLPFLIGRFGILPALSILLLVISDLLLARNRMVTETPVSRSLALLYYFGGQFLMAMTLYLPSV